MRSDLIDISGYPVMVKKCATCPFRTDEHGRHPDVALVAKIQQRCLTEASQICHHPELKGQSGTHLCRGARDFQLEIFHRMGLLSEPTDAEWERKALAIGIGLRANVHSSCVNCALELSLVKDRPGSSNAD